MKKIIALALALVASTAYANVAGSAHDLTDTNNSVAGSCQFCHMVHNANTAVTAAPIWAKAVRTYTLYGATVSGTPAPSAIGAISQACMSCHDGTAGAVTTQHNGASLGDTRTVATANNLGSTLANDHPVSISYRGTSASQAGLITLAAAQAAPNNFVFFGPQTDQLECGSCHNPHHLEGSVYLLRVPSTMDACAACHANK